MHMVTERQRKTALILSIFWATALMTAYMVSVTYELELNWIFVLISLLLLMVAMVTSLGYIGFFFPYCLLDDRSEFNVEKIGLLLGPMMLMVSCILLFLSLDSILLLVLIGVAIPVECGGLYTCASKKFKADVIHN
jgi:hypothetical protein